jgi:hypothetical protein
MKVHRSTARRWGKAVREGSLRWRATAFGVAAVVALVFVAPIASARAATTSKPYAVIINFSSVAAGSTNQFSVTLKNETTTQQLGSANITPPAGFTVTSAVSPPGTGTVSSNVIQLRNLSVPPGGSITVTFLLSASCAGGGGAWTLVVKQANNFSGTPGNDLTFDQANSSPNPLATTVTGSCHLAFTGQPADTGVNTIITTTPGDPAGAPIEVDVLDGNGNLVTSSTAAITVAIDPSSPQIGPGAMLGPADGLTQTASGGKALFSDLTINVIGVYDLVATSPGLTPPLPAPQVTSAIFHIGAACQLNCNATVSQPKKQTSQVSAPSTSGFLFLSVGVVHVQDLPLQCQNDGFFHAPGVSTVSSLNFTAGVATKTLVVAIDKSVVQGNGPNNGVSSYQVCYQNPITGVIIDPLPMCNKTGGAPPCVDSITKTNAGSIIETITLSGDDPNCW